MIGLRRRLVLGLLAATAVASLSGCGAGARAQSVQPYAPADGVLATSGSIRVLNALVVEAEGSSRGVVSLTIVNRGTRDDRLRGLTSDDGTVDLTGDRTLRAEGSVRFGAATSPSATIDGMTRAPGQEITLVLTFARAGPVRLHTVVVPATGPYAQVTPGPETPAASSTPTQSASPSP